MPPAAPPPGQAAPAAASSGAGPPPAAPPATGPAAAPQAPAGIAPRRACARRDGAAAAGGRQRGAGGGPAGRRALGAGRGSPACRPLPGSPLRGGPAIAALAGAAWLLWAVFAAALVAEVTARACGRAVPRLPAIAPVQALAAALAGTAVITALHLPQAAGARRAAPARHAGRRHRRRAAPRPTASPPAMTCGTSPRGSSATPATGPGSSASTTARPQPGGRALTDPRLILPGWVLLIPQPAGPHRAAPRPPGPGPDRPGTSRATRQPPRPGPSRPRPRPGTDRPRARPAPHAAQPHPVAVRLPSGAIIGIAVAAMVAAALAVAAVQRRRRYRPRPGLPAAARRRAGRPGPGPSRTLRRGPPRRHAAWSSRTAARAGHPARPAGPGNRQARQRSRSASAATAARPPPTSPACAAWAWPGPAPCPRPARSWPACSPSTRPAAPPGRPRSSSRPPTPPGCCPAPARPPIPGVSVPATPRRGPGRDWKPSCSPGARRRARPDDRPAPARPGAGPGITLIAAAEPARPGGWPASWPPAASSAAAAVLLGAWPAGTTCQVAADGTVTAVTPASPALDQVRLFTLGAADAAAITGVLHEAAASPPDDPARPHPARREPGQPHPPGRSRGPGPGQAPAAAPARAPPPPAGAAGTAPAPGPADRPVRISVLGPLRITAAGRRSAAGCARPASCSPSWPSTPTAPAGEAISEALCPDADPGQAAGQRNLALRKARDMLRTAAGLPAPLWILNAAGRYRLDPALISTDLQAFSAALEQARNASGDGPAGRLPARRSRCTAASSPRAPDTTGPSRTPRPPAAAPWTPGPPSRRSSQPADPDQALSALETALAHDPYNEYLYQQIMRLQAAAGRPEAVRRTLACWKPGSPTSASPRPPRPARPPPPCSAPPDPTRPRSGQQRRPAARPGTPTAEHAIARAATEPRRGARPARAADGSIPAARSRRYRHHQAGTGPPRRQGSATARTRQVPAGSQPDPRQPCPADGQAGRHRAAQRPAEPCRPRTGRHSAPPAIPYSIPYTCRHRNPRTRGMRRQCPE